MEQNPLEQQKIKIDAVRKEMEGKLGRLFDEKEKLKKSIDNLILKLDILQKNGLVFNQEEVISGLKESEGIGDKEAFMAHLMKVLEPLIVLRVTQASTFEKTERDTLNDGENLKLSEVLYTSLGEVNNKGIAIHLASAAELIKEKGMGNFKREIENGLVKLAEIVEADPNIERIDAVSWIVAKNPVLLKRLGFTVVGEISEEEKGENFSDEKRPIAAAYINRKEFLAKYGKKI